MPEHTICAADPCNHCGGTGSDPLQEWDSYHQRYVTKNRPCTACSGSGRR